MANKTFNKANYSNAVDPIQLYGAFNIGSAGTPASLIGDGFNSVAESATGIYKLVLSDPYNRFLGYQASINCDVDGTAQTARTGEADIQTVTFPAKASATAGDHIVLTDTTGTTWAIALDVAGTDPEPTAASWTAVAGARKVNVDISGATTAAQVAAAVEAAFDALTGVSSVWATDDGAADGTMTFTTVVRAPVAAVVSTHNEDDSGAGSMTSVHTKTGVATAVNLNDQVTFAAHGFQTGKAVALTIDSGSLPAGLSATTYYLIVVDANTVKFATSLANAEAGTAVNITDYGTAAKIMTITPVISGSGVFKTELITSDIQNVIKNANPELEIAFYNASGALVQPANGTVVHFCLQLRNSSCPMKGE